MGDADPGPQAEPGLLTGARVHGLDGLRGVVEAVNPSGTAAVVKLASGHRIRVPVDCFEPGEDAALGLPIGPDAVESAAKRRDEAPAEALTVPVLEERVLLGKEKVVTGRVRLHKTVHTEERELAVPLLHETVDVQRVRVDAAVDDPAHPPEPREVDGVLIVPVLEERLVVVKQLFLKEEVHVTRVRRVEQHTESVDVRREELRVERVASDASPPGPSGTRA